METVSTVTGLRGTKPLKTNILHVPPGYPPHPQKENWLGKGPRHW